MPKKTSTMLNAIQRNECTWGKSVRDGAYQCVPYRKPRFHICISGRLHLPTRSLPSDMTCNDRTGPQNLDDRLAFLQSTLTSANHKFP